MRAVLMRTFGDEDVLSLEEVPDPAPGIGEVLVRVGAVAVSSTRDVATRTGRHPFSRQVSLPHILGGDFAGTVETVGPDVDPEWIGRRVAAANSRGCGVCPACQGDNEAQCPRLEMLGIHRWGSYAELATVGIDNINEIPDGISLAVAAAMAATGPIALTQLRVGEVGQGTWLLVTGVTGALGTTLAALAAQLGARVLGLSRRPSRIPAELDLEARLDSGDDGLTDTLMQLTAPDGVATAIDNVADGDVFMRYFPTLAIGGRVVISGAVGGSQQPVLPVPAGPFYLRSLSLLGVRTTTRSQIDAFWQLAHDGLRLPGGLVHELDLGEAAQAHAAIATGASTGHTILSVAS